MSPNSKVILEVCRKSLEILEKLTGETGIKGGMSNSSY
jgi:hypothetical protein